ncbi:hypothetical protein CEXT_312021 [Caerostris extrusa]|uniref:Uncharacterized protein n=1 Tax=Caerostris extrusa TaxID=172846 RepID=A0AAV4RF20_CAEEX|nr:hypothetical protein CEXT_312021 [Caerostris extrusa]
MCHSPLIDLDVSEFVFAVKECPSFENPPLQKIIAFKKICLDSTKNTVQENLERGTKTVRHNFSVVSKEKWVNRQERKSMWRGKCLCFNVEHEKGHIRRCGKMLSSVGVSHGDLMFVIVSGFGFRDGLRPREYVEQLAPEVLLAPSEVCGAVEIELDLLGQLIVLGQIRQLDDDDAGNLIFQGLSVGRVELQTAPLAFKKIPGKKEHRLSASEGHSS